MTDGGMVPMFGPAGVHPRPELTLEQWTERYAEEADRQGWNLFESDERGLEIERDDEARLFDSDEDALRYVIRQAERNQASAIEALRLVALAQAEAADDDPEDEETERGIRALTELPAPQSPEVEALIVEVKVMLTHALYEDGVAKLLTADVDAVEAALKLIEPEWDEYTHGRDEPIDHTAAAHWDDVDVADVR